MLILYAYTFINVCTYTAIHVDAHVFIHKYTLELTQYICKLIHLYAYTVRLHTCTITHSNAYTLVDLYACMLIQL